MYNVLIYWIISLISLHCMMSNKQTQTKKGARNRIRCYSSMNYQEYRDFFGTPPKMPEPPNTKPQEDPNDIPELFLQIEQTDQSVKTKNSVETRITYKIQPIPEVDSSQANQLGLSPRIKMDFFQFNSTTKMKTDDINEQELVSVQRSRSRPRSFSENSPIIAKFRIIDFLNQSNNKGRKQIKKQ